MMEKTNWNKKRVLITGGTSGLGLALARRLKALGAEVAIVARNAQKVKEVASETGVLGIAADVSNKSDIHRISGQVLGQLGGIDVLINNASALGPTPLRSLLETECEDIEAVLQANVLGPFRLIKALLPQMLLQGGGTVVNISSDAAVSAYPNWGAYSLSKAALDHMSRVWSEELSAAGVKFLSVDPGDMNTPMHEAAIPGASPDSLSQPSDVANELSGFILDAQGSVRFAASQWRKQI